MDVEVNRRRLRCRPEMSGTDGFMVERGKLN